MSAKISAEIIADSINPQGDRITTYLLTFPRFILAELNTHRVFSKNSASSRAIPFHKMVEMVETDPFIPIAWQKDHKGMQGVEYLDEEMSKVAKDEWLIARNEAIRSAKILNEEEFVTKQLCNRLLEPFMWHTVLLTGTEFKNFFELRCPLYQTPVSQTVEPQYSWKDLEEVHSNPINLEILENNRDNYTFKFQHSKSNAEIHMQVLAEAMWDAMNESTPKQLQAGEWHIPFGDKIDSLDSITDKSPIERLSKEINHTSVAYSEDIETLAIKISTARCARLSYMTFDGKVDYEKDLKLHDTLLESQHMSPFEHCARAMTDPEYYSFVKGESVSEQRVRNRFTNRHYGWCNNFKGFIQYRYLIEK